MLKTVTAITPPATVNIGDDKRQNLEPETPEAAVEHGVALFFAREHVDISQRRIDCRMAQDRAFGSSAGATAATLPFALKDSATGSWIAG